MIIKQIRKKNFIWQRWINASFYLFVRGLHDLSVTLFGQSVVPDHMINISDASAGHCEERKRRQLPNRIDQNSRKCAVQKISV